MIDNALEIKKEKRKKIVKIVLNVLFYLIMAVIIATLLYGVVLKAKGNQSFYVFGYRAMIVSSSSMSSKHPNNAEFLEGHDEQMQIGDLVITRKLRADETLQVYDIVTFVDSQGKTIIHRIVEATVYENATVYRTRGDATDTLDAPRTRSQYEDIYVTNAKSIGKIIRFLQEPAGIIIVIIVIVLIVLISYLIKVIVLKRRAKIEAETPIVPPDEKKKKAKSIGANEEKKITDDRPQEAKTTAGESPQETEKGFENDG